MGAYVDFYNAPTRLKTGDVVYCKIKQKGYNWIVREVRATTYAVAHGDLRSAQSVVASAPGQGSVRFVWVDCVSYGCNNGTPHFHFVRHAKDA